MTVGKDVSSLFTDVVNLNTFVKDSQDPNPLIRALVVRTMGCIRVDKITEYLCDPLQRCLKDNDPYVRKTASICVEKLYDINAGLVEDRGFLESLKDLISDNNPMVVANVVAALAEIQDNSSRPIIIRTTTKLAMSKKIVSNLLQNQPCIEIWKTKNQLTAQLPIHNKQ
ncbi:hypothetical protein RYX36_032325 [Vicia faba]